MYGKRYVNCMTLNSDVAPEPRVAPYSLKTKPTYLSRNILEELYQAIFTQHLKHFTKSFLNSV